MDTVSAQVVTEPEQGRLITRPFVLVTSVAMIFFVYVGILVPIVPLYIEGPLGAGEFGIGLTVAVFAVAAIAVRPIVGRIADRFGRRVLMVGGALLAAAGGALSGHTSELWQLLDLRGVMGIGEAAVFVGAATLIADLSPRDRRAESASYFSVAIFGGLGVGPILGEWLLGGDDDFTQAFMYAALFAVAAAVLACFAPSRVESPRRRGDARRIGTCDAADEKRPLIHHAAVLPGLVLACTVAGVRHVRCVHPRLLPRGRHGRVRWTVRRVRALLVAHPRVRRPHARAARPASGGHHRHQQHHDLAADPVARARRCRRSGSPRSFMGLGVAFNYPSLMALTVNRASDRDRAMAVSSFTMFFEVGSAVGGLLLGAWAQVVGKQYGFLGGVVFCVVGLWLLRAKVVPPEAPDGGPAVTQTVAGINYIPVAGD